MPGRLDDLDDPDYPAYTTGRAAEVLGVQQAFLRSLDAAKAVVPQRTVGGRRRYSRRQLALAARIRKLLDQGYTLAAALRILALEDELASERALTASLNARLAGREPSGLLAIARPLDRPVDRPVAWPVARPAARPDPAGTAEPDPAACTRPGPASLPIPAGSVWSSHVRAGPDHPRAPDSGAQR